MAWDKLKSTFATTDLASIQRLYCEFNSIQKTRNESMLSYIARVHTAYKQLTGAGETITVTNLINKTVSGLGDRYEAIKIYLAMDDKLTEERMTKVLLAEETRQNAASLANGGSSSHFRSRSPGNRYRPLDRTVDNRYRPLDRTVDRAYDRPSDRNYGYDTRARSRDRSGTTSRVRSPGRRSKYCKTCDMVGHSEESCFRLHPELYARRRLDQEERRARTDQDERRARADQEERRARLDREERRARLDQEERRARLDQEERRVRLEQEERRRHPTTPLAPRTEQQLSYMDNQTLYLDSEQARYDEYHCNDRSSPPPRVDRHDPPSAHAHGYALPAQLTEDTVWEYYHNAMMLVRTRTWHALHHHDIAIASAGCWSIRSVDAQPPAPTTASQGSEYVQAPQPGQWLIDSGASNHFTNKKHLLSDYRDCADERILTGNGFIIAKGIGNITIHSSLGLRTIYDVLYVPDLAGHNNLLSIPQIVRKGCKISMSSGGCKVFSDDSESVLLLEGTFSGKGFLVDMSVCRTTTQIAELFGNQLLHPPCGSHTALLAGSSDTQPIEIWHMRLGHLNQTAIQLLTSNATGLNIGPARPQTLSMRCESCLRGAQHRNVSYQRGNRATKRLEHVWADLKGPLLDKDIYGFRYFCTFICEYTRWIVQYPLLEKKHTFGAYKLFAARYEKLAGSPILNLHIDGGSEYFTNEFRLHLRNTGVAVCPTQPYSPEMNSIAERAMRSIIEHASAMLWNASLPVGFWSAAVETSVYLLNRSPHSALNNKTPYEAWHGSKPNLGHLRVFGCRAAAHVPDELRSKSDWTSKSSPNCVFIGYSETENLFKLWDVDKHSAIRKRDVVFHEHEMSHPSLRPHSLTFGTSIYPDIGSPLPDPGELAARDTASVPGNDSVDGIAGRIADSMQDELQPPETGVISSEIPLPPLDARQTLDKLPSEAKERDRVAKGGPLRFIHYEPPQQKTGALLLMKQIDDFDAEYLSLAAMTTDPPEIHPIDILDTANRDPSSIALFPTIIPGPERHIPSTYRQAMAHPHRERWIRAMEKELRSLENNCTWELVPLPPGRKAFPNKWVFSYVSGPKLTDILSKEIGATGPLTTSQKVDLEALGQNRDSVIEKARLVARGDYQKEGIDYHETYAPVVKFVSFRILLTWAAQRRLKTRHWDIVSAFLHGKIDMEIFMQQPQGFSDGTNRVCRLNKAIYGLCQAARQFYLRLDEVLQKLSFRRLAMDWAIWLRDEDGAFIAAHVDDMAAAAKSDQDLDQIANLFAGFMELKDLGEITQYLSITVRREITPSRSVFMLSQEHYIAKLLQEYQMESAFEVATPVLESDWSRWDKDDTELLNEKTQKLYQALIGSLLYLMHATRPDIAYPIIKLSQYSSKPKECHWLALKRVLRYLKGTSSACLILGDTATEGDKGLVGYFDAAHADNSNRRSTCGYIFLLYGSPISWVTRVQRTIALSTTDAELMAGTEATREAIWIKGITDVLFAINNPDYVARCELRGDNQGSLALSVNPVYHQRTKHIDIRYRFICEMVNAGVVQVRYVPSKDMLADGFTKPLPRDTHLDHCLRIGLQLHPTPSGTACMAILKRKKIRCDDCGNLFADDTALRRHKLKKEK